jgi:OTU domain-containing protein 6
MGRLGKAFKSKRKPGAEQEEDEGASGSEAEQPKQQQQAPPPPKPAAAAAAAAAAPPAAGSDDGDDEDGPHSSGPETRGHMVQRHKRELMALKKQRGKGKAEAAKALADLEARHAKELAEHDKAAAAAPAAPSSPSKAAATADRASKYLAGVSLADGDEGASKSSKGPSKAQKRRDKLAQREQERDARIAAELAALGPTERAQEAAALRSLLAPLGLAVKSIRADGHCLYHSVADQLAQHPSGDDSSAADGPLPDFLALRRLAAEHMRARRDDFEPFVSAAEASGRGVPHGVRGEEEEEDDGDEKDAFEAYVSSVEKTAAWGGHVELTALAGALKRRIRVVAVGMPEVVAGEEFDDEKEALTVCYVRHEFGLGEHYNSVRPRVEGEEEDGEEEGEAAAAAAAAAEDGGDEE